MVALLVVAVALGLNNFGAAIAIGVSGVDGRTEIKVATVFGLCDVVMPATGMLIGTGLAGPLGSAARWAGAGILFATAIWGLVEALRGDDDAPKVWHGWRLLVSGAALSLDDLAVGLALGTVRYPIVLAVTLFGLMSFVMSIIGLKLGGKLGKATGEHGEVVGAIVLIGISGAMAAGWLLPDSRQPDPLVTKVDRLSSSAVHYLSDEPTRSGWRRVTVPEMAGLDEGTPLFAQVAERLAGEIADGGLAEGERVPSTNELAAFYRINPATAAKGINVLADDRLLEKRRGIGMFVATGARQRLLARRRAEFAQRYVEPLLAEAARLGIDTDELIALIKESGNEREGVSL